MASNERRPDSDGNEEGDSSEDRRIRPRARWKATSSDAPHLYCATCDIEIDDLHRRLCPTCGAILSTADQRREKELAARKKELAPAKEDRIVYSGTTREGAMRPGAKERIAAVINLAGYILIILASTLCVVGLTTPDSNLVRGFVVALVAGALGVTALALANRVHRRTNSNWKAATSLLFAVRRRLAAGLHALPPIRTIPYRAARQLAASITRTGERTAMTSETEPFTPVTNAADSLNGTWQVQSSEGAEVHVFTSISSLTTAIQEGKVRPGDRARRLRHSDETNETKPEPWKPLVDTLAKSSFDVRVLLQPVWAHTLLGGTTAARVGIVICLGNLAVNFLHSKEYGIAYWLGAIAVLWLLEKGKRGEFLAFVTGAAVLLSARIPAWKVLPVRPPWESPPVGLLVQLGATVWNLYQ